MLWREWGEGLWELKGQGNQKKTTESSDLGPQRLSLQWERLHETDQGSLHLRYCCVPWSSFGTPNSGSRGLSLTQSPVLGTLSSYWLLCPTSIGEEVSSLTAVWFTMTGWYTQDACCFLKRKEDRIGELGKSGGWGEGLRGEVAGNGNWIGWTNS